MWSICRGAIWSAHLLVADSSLKSVTKSLEDDPVEDLDWDRQHSDASLIGAVS